MATAGLEYVAAGGNRHSSAADWAPGLLAYGAGHNLALWNPENEDHKGISSLIAGHTDDINAVKIHDCQGKKRIITGSADKTIRIWEAENGTFKNRQSLTEHQGSVNVISALPENDIFVSGSADGTIKVWNLSNSEAKLVQSVSLKPRYIPLACALVQLENGTVILAVAGTSYHIQLFARCDTSAQFELQATLTGHEGWIRSLDFVKESHGHRSDILLASASQDKYIRLWRLHQSQDSTALPDTSAAGTAPVKKSLSNKAHQVGSTSNKYNVTFEALLIGHEDWVYTAKWAPTGAQSSGPTLLSASADNSVAMWRPDETSGVWLCDTRLGEISSQKGSTTATGSTGGFWIGLWQPDGFGVVSLGRTGSWRRWAYDSRSDSWLQQVSVSGHTKEVQGLAWAPDGSYLLSTGSDQTTRLLAEWKRDGKISWHEFARPQIHGYDLNCIGPLTPNQFISGADEKLLRVFNKPKAIDQLLFNLSGSHGAVNGELPDAANIPVLGLSNKAITATSDGDAADEALQNGVDGDGDNPETVVRKSTLELSHPPFEEHLARQTLWPEHEKLYGHGYEISAVACSNDGSLVATACKASSIDHAVIRLYDCREWRELKPPLTAHSLTVTSLAFSPDDRHLLSVGRDRSWFVFERDGGESNTFHLLCSNPKGHTRMILDCSWARWESGHIFATAGRDKAVKIWRLSDEKVDCLQTLTASTAVTAVAFDSKSDPDGVSLAYGTDEGDIHIARLKPDSLEPASNSCLDKGITPSGTINTLRWRPENTSRGTAAKANQLAVASDDSSVRIFNIDH